MREQEIQTMLSNLINGEINIKEVIATLKNSLFRDHKLSHANPDYHRELRHNLNEVIYGEGKTIEQIIHIAEQLARNKRCVLISRLDENKISALQLTFPNGRSNVLARTFVINPPQELINKQNQKFVAIVSAGTSDIPIAEEAQEVCFAMRIHTRLIPDVGVAGLHRVLNILDVLHQANVIIVIAGMEGALPSVIGGLVGKPIIAVPTSIGYGASLNGLAALLGMLNSCAPGLLVTNIDAGFSAGFAAARIINEMENNENTLSG